MSLKTQFYLVGWLCLCALPNILQANIPFLQKDLAEVRRMAAQEGKLYFAHFSAEWCMVCTWMEENTFQDPTLGAFVEDNYLPVKINYDEAPNQRYNEQFKITALPTILVFNSQGILLDKIQYSIEANELLRVLEQHNVARNKVSASIEPQEKENILDSPEPELVLHRPALKPEKPNESYRAKPGPAGAFDQGFDSDLEEIVGTGNTTPIPAQPKIRTMPNETEVASAPSGVKETGLYYHTLEMPPANPPTLPELSPNMDYLAPRSSRKYYIELGVHNAYDKAQQQKASLEKEIGEKLHLISTTTRNQTLYKVISSTFPDFSSAQKNYRLLKEKSIYGLIQLVD